MSRSQLSREPAGATAIAVLGLGEAGGAIAADLARGGADVRGWDPLAERIIDGVARAAQPAEAVRDASVVLSVNAAAAALEAARSVLGQLGPGQVFADLNSAGPPLKRELDALVAPTGAGFADVALMGVVPSTGVRTPALVSGTGADDFARRMGPLGMPVEVVGCEAGVAATRKLLRSVFMKGLAATIIEALAAGAEAGCEDWLRAEIAAVLTSADAALLDRLESGSRRHAARRVHEVTDAGDLLRELGVEPRICEATAAWLLQLQRTEAVHDA